jgi:TRAP-type uncharacterized transport system substrate-binding protein
MDSSMCRRLVVMLACGLVPLALAPRAGAQSLTDQTNRGVVEIETGNTDGISGKIADDLAGLLDDGATRRVVPVIGEGSLQNIVDVKVLRGIDMAVVQIDALDYARAQKLVPGIESMTYIAKLYNEEFHLLARADTKTVDALAGKKVNFDGRGTGTGVTATRLFSLLGIKVDPTSYATGSAIERLEKGEIDAVAFVGAKPAPVLRDVSTTENLHFLAIPVRPAITAVYPPTQLTSKDYPGIVPDGAPVDTVAVGTALMAANLTPGSERARNLSNFINAFFTQFPSLLEAGHHPKWKEVNLAADIPGWKRSPVAEQWLQANATVAKQATPADLKMVFERFLEERSKSAGGTALSHEQQDEIFSEFQRWQAGQVH